MKINLLCYSPAIPWKAMHFSVIDILCGRHKIQVYTIWVEGPYSVFAIISTSVLSSLPWAKRFLMVWQEPGLLQACVNRWTSVQNSDSFYICVCFCEFAQVCASTLPSMCAASSVCLCALLVSFLSLNLFLLLRDCVSTSKCMCACVHECRCLRRPEEGVRWISWSWSYPWLWATQHGSPIRAARVALHCWAISWA